MDGNALSVSDWINIAVAVGVAATAVFTAVTASAARKQARLYAPVVRHRVHRSSDQPLPLVTMGLIAADRQRYAVVRLTILRPRKARFYEARFIQGATGALKNEPAGRPLRTVHVSPEDDGVGAFLDAAQAEEVSIRVHVALRADSRIKSRLTIRINMKDW